MTNTFRANYSTSFEAQAILYLVRQIEFPVSMEHLPLPLPAYTGTLPTIHFKNDVGNTTAAMPIKVYPNPSNGSISIDIAENHNNVVLTLLSIDGKTMLQMPLQIGLNTLQLSQLPTGIYYYVITSDHTLLGRDKLVIIK
ncbi:MAG TPA: T9SS type A sorting domain-containing protein [Chitinophagales bacterium]|nr:T9SS type A sorting domain-containing protein [Chitinophagales bacterium]